MLFSEVNIHGAYLITMEPHHDERGYFARTWCQEEFNRIGLASEWKQCSVSYNKKAGTLRGMHYQAAPYEENKLIRVIKGAIYDVIVDIRPSSPTFKRWQAFELSDRTYTQLYVPKGVAHGFQTLQDDTEILYQISEVFKPDSSRGIYYLDPAFTINWPIQPPTVISDKDLSYKNWG